MDSGALLIGEDGVLVLSHEPFLVGEILADKYRVERVIGEGAMGIVLAATHLELDEIVAVKFIRPELQEVPGAVGRFAREAKALVKIKSEHTAKVLDVGIIPTRGPYIVMEYLEGRDLASMLVEHGALPVRRVVEYMMQACEALAMAHANGIIHRDIKPENLYLTRSGDLDVIKVLDFGISKAALVGRVLGGDLSMVQTSYLMGTPLYMSPEQIRATTDVDQRADIWSIGVVLYELLTGRHAFLADSVTQICALVLESEPPPMQGSLLAAPGLQLIVRRCLEKDPANRFQNVAELAFALQPYAPSRSRVYADRCAAILRGAGFTVDIETRHSSMPSPSDGAMAVSVSRTPTQRRSHSGLSAARLSAQAQQPTLALEPKVVRPRSRWPLAASAVLLGCVLGLWLTRAVQRHDLFATNPPPVQRPNSAVQPREIQASDSKPHGLPQPESVRSASPAAHAETAGHAGAGPQLPGALRGRVMRVLTPARPNPTGPIGANHWGDNAPRPTPIESKPRARLVDDPARVPIIQ